MDASEGPEKAQLIERNVALLALIAVCAAGFNSLIDYIVPLVHLYFTDARVNVYDSGGSPYSAVFANLPPSMQAAHRAELTGRWPVYLAFWVLWCIAPLTTMVVCGSMRPWIRQIARAWLKVCCVVCVIFACIPPDPEGYFVLSLEPVIAVLVAFLMTAATVGGFGGIGIAVSFFSMVKLATERRAARSEV
jgi:hypothetical protein